MSVLIDRFDVFAGGFWLTLQLCVLAAIGALVLGTIVAVLRISPLPPLRAVGTAYVTVLRNVPLTVVMFFMAFGLPALGSNANFLRIPGLDLIFRRLATSLPYFRFAVIALSIYTAAFVCEAIRAGINAVSLDSRCQGTVPVGDVIGRAFVVVWPPSRWGGLSTPPTFSGVPRATALGAPAHRVPVADGPPRPGVGLVIPALPPAVSVGGGVRRRRRLPA